CRESGGRPQLLRRTRSDDVAGGGRREQRPDEVGAAPLVLLGARLVVLVAPDRDVLGAVIRGERVAAQREQRGRGGEKARDELLRRLAEPGAPNALEDNCRPDHRCEHAWPLERQPGLGERTLDARQEGEGLREARGAAQDRVLDLRAEEA